MGTVYTRRMFGGHSIPAPGERVTTVPAGELWVIRDIVVHFFQPETTELVVKAASTGDSYELIVMAAAAGAWQHQELRQTVNAGETIHHWTDAGYANYAITGYKFTL